MKLADEQKVARSWRNHRGEVQQAASPQLAAHRGWQVGIHDAYKWLLHRYPTAAKKLREHYGMAPDGSITLVGKGSREGASVTEKHT